VKKTLAVAVATMTMLGSAPAAAACAIGDIVGTWVVQVTRTVEDLYFPGPTTASTTCWFVITRPDNLGIHCDRAWLDDRIDFFGLFQTDFEQRPWHQIVGPDLRTRQTTDTGRRFVVRNRCEWTIRDRNGIDIEYTVWFSPTGALSGSGQGFQDQHFGATEPMLVTFNGVRQ
jgi:hypothetical protein